LRQLDAELVHAEPESSEGAVSGLWLPRIRFLSGHADLSRPVPVHPRDAPAMRQHGPDGLRRSR
jgi:hypothetical protein